MSDNSSTWLEEISKRGQQALSVAAGGPHARFVVGRTPLGGIRTWTPKPATAVAASWTDEFREWFTADPMALNDPVLSAAKGFRCFAAWNLVERDIRGGQFKDELAKVECEIISRVLIALDSRFPGNSASIVRKVIGRYFNGTRLDFEFMAELVTRGEVQPDSSVVLLSTAQEWQKIAAEFEGLESDGVRAEASWSDFSLRVSSREYDGGRGGFCARHALACHWSARSSDSTWRRFWTAARRAALRSNGFDCAHCWLDSVRAKGLLKAGPTGSSSAMGVSSRNEWFDDIFSASRDLAQRMVAEKEAALRLSQPTDGHVSAQPIPPATNPDGRSMPTTSMAARRRLSASVESAVAARKMEVFIQSKAMSQSEFAVQAGTSDRTLRKFRETGRVRRDIFGKIAQVMGVTLADLAQE